MLPWIAFSWTLSSTALAADPRDALVEAYRDTPVSARVLFVVQSGSLDPEGHDQIRAELAAAAHTLPAGTEMEVLAYADQATVAWPVHTLPEGGRETLAAELQALPLPEGSYLDLGAAMALVVSELKTASSVDLGLVVFRGKLCNDPPEGSAYAFSGTAGCRQVRGLPEIAEAVEKLRPRTVLTPVSVTIGRPDPIGSKAISKVFGSGANYSARADGGWVPQVVGELPYLKIQGLIDAEVSGLAPRISATKVEGDVVTLTVDSGLQRLALRLDSLAFQGEGLEVATPTVTLSPGAEISLKAVLPEPPYSPLPSSRELVLEGQLRATATLEPRTGLARLKVSPGRGIISMPLRVVVVQHYGLPAWLSALGGLAAVGVAGMVWRKRRRPAQDPSGGDST